MKTEILTAYQVYNNIHKLKQDYFYIIIIKDDSTAFSKP
jgi:hypothetical protein